MFITKGSFRLGFGKVRSSRSCASLLRVFLSRLSRKWAPWTRMSQPVDTSFTSAWWQRQTTTTTSPWKITKVRSCYCHCWRQQLQTRNARPFQIMHPSQEQGHEWKGDGPTQTISTCRFLSWRRICYLNHFRAKSNRKNLDFFFRHLCPFYFILNNLHWGSFNALKSPWYVNTTWDTQNNI